MARVLIGNIKGTKGDPGDSYVLTEQDKADIAALTPIPDVSAQIAVHNENTAAHADIRSLIAAKSDGQVYSTEETAVGTWIDGRTIYRKTIVYTVNPLPTSKWAYYRFSTDEQTAMAVDQFTNMSGVASCYSVIADETPVWQPIPRVCPDAVPEYSIGFGDLSPEKLGVLFGTEYTGATIYFTVEYVKNA